MKDLNRRKRRYSSEGLKIVDEIFRPIKNEDKKLKSVVIDKGEKLSLMTQIQRKKILLSTEEDIKTFGVDNRAKESVQK